MPHPAGAGRGAGDAEVGEPGPEEGEHLVAAGGRFDADPTRLQDCEEVAGVAREPEEPVLLSHQLRSEPVLGAQAVVELGGRVELLAAGTVPPLVVPQVEVATVRALPPQALHPGPVPGIGAGRDEVVERQRQRPAQPAEPGRIVADELTHPHPGRTGGGDVLQRVIVGAGEEPHRLAAQPPVPGQHVGLHQFQRMPEVRLRVDVRDRGRDVEVAVGLHGLPSALRQRRPQSEQPRVAGAAGWVTDSAHAREPRWRGHHPVQWLVHTASVAQGRRQAVLNYAGGAVEDWSCPAQMRRRGG